MYRARLPTVQSPVPFRCTVCGLAEALSAVRTRPVGTPLDLGLSDTSIVQLFPISRRLPQLLVCRKSPVTMMMESLSGPFPELVNVIFLGGSGLSSKFGAEVEGCREQLGRRYAQLQRGNGFARVNTLVGHPQIVDVV